MMVRLSRTVAIYRLKTLKIETSKKMTCYGTNGMTVKIKIEAQQLNYQDDLVDNRSELFQFRVDT